MKPLGNRIIVESEEKSKTTMSGIIIPDSAEESQEPKIGKVKSIGTRIKEDIKVGDVVVFGKYSGFEITLDKKKHMILSVDDVLGIK